MNSAISAQLSNAAAATSAISGEAFTKDGHDLVLTPTQLTDVEDSEGYGTTEHGRRDRQVWLLVGLHAQFKNLSIDDWVGTPIHRTTPAQRLTIRSIDTTSDPQWVRIVAVTTTGSK